MRNDETKTDELEPTELETGSMEPAPPPKQRRGFAAMPRERLQAIASAGGRSTKERGKLRKFTSGEEAREAGRKGGIAPHRSRGPGARRREVAS